jgi:hypothetical protein
MCDQKQVIREQWLPRPTFFDRVVEALAGNEIVPADHLFRRVRNDSARGGRKGNGRPD